MQQGSARSTKGTWKRWVFVFALLLLIILFGGMLLFDYSASRALVIGAILGWVIAVIGHYVAVVLRALDGQQRVALVILMLLGVAFTAGVSSCVYLAQPVMRAGDQSGGGGVQGGGPMDTTDVTPYLQGYEVAVDPIGLEELNAFRVRYTLTVAYEIDGGDKPWVRYPRTFAAEEEISSFTAHRGVLMREVRIYPKLEAFEAAPDSDRPRYEVTAEPYSNTVFVKSGTKPPLVGYVCQAQCPSAEAKLENFPKSAFVSVDNKRSDPSILAPFSGKVDVRWPLDSMEDPITFRYIRAPYHSIPLVHQLLVPFEGVSSRGGFVVALLGLLLAGVAALGGLGAFISNMEALARSIKRVRGGSEG